MSIHSEELEALPSPRPEQNDKRRRILEAAIQVFAARGFYNARVSDIAREARVADGTIYLYFKNKDDLLISLFEDRMDEVLRIFREEVGVEGSAAQRLQRFIEVHLRLVSEEPVLAEVLTVELRQSAKFMREYRAPKFAEFLQLLEDIIEDGRAAGEFSPETDPRVLRLVIFGALDEVSMQWVSGRRRPFGLDEAAQQIWSICAGGILARPQLHSANGDGA